MLNASGECESVTCDDPNAVVDTTCTAKSTGSLGTCVSRGCRCKSDYTLISGTCQGGQNIKGLAGVEQRLNNKLFINSCHEFIVVGNFVCAGGKMTNRKVSTNLWML